MTVIKILLGLLLLLTTHFSYAVVQQYMTFSTDEINPGDVFTKARLIEEELLTFDKSGELFTKPMITVAYKVERASSKDVFFLAKSLNFSAKRLSLNHTNEVVGREFAVHVYRNQPLHVYRVLNEALKSIQAAQRSLSIQGFNSELTPVSATPTQVYNKILMNNRLVSILNQDKVDPRDVIKIIDHCYELSLRLFHTQQGDRNIRPFVPSKNTQTDKTPTDVFYHLISTFQSLNQYAKSNLNLTAMQISATNTQREILPSDVMDIAMALNAELTYLAYQAKVKIPFDTSITRQEVTSNMVFDMVSRIQHVFKQP